MKTFEYKKLISNICAGFKAEFPCSTVRNVNAFRAGCKRGTEIIDSYLDENARFTAAEGAAISEQLNDMGNFNNLDYARGLLIVKEAVEKMTKQYETVVQYV